MPAAVKIIVICGANADMEKISERNLAVAPFLKLPGELRNRIYEFVLDPVEVLVLHSGRIHVDSEKFCGANYIALLQLCRQIYRDTRLLLWSKARFVCDNMDKFVKWVSEYPAECRTAVTLMTIKSSPTSEYMEDWVDPWVFHQFPSLRHLHIDVVWDVWVGPQINQEKLREGLEKHFWGSKSALKALAADARLEITFQKDGLRGLRFSRIKYRALCSCIVLE